MMLKEFIDSLSSGRQAQNTLFDHYISASAGGTPASRLTLYYHATLEIRYLDKVLLVFHSPRWTQDCIQLF